MVEAEDKFSWLLGEVVNLGSLLFLCDHVLVVAIGSSNSSIIV